MQDLFKLDFKKEVVGGPAFYKGKLKIVSEDNIGDTYINLENFTKGIVYVNGFNLGRYWNVGPQLNLYVPYPLPKVGDNEIIVFEQHGCEKAIVKFEGRPLWK